MSKTLTKTEVADWRREYVFEAGACDLCGCRELDRIACHEVSRGQNRQNALTEPACLLVVCWLCHRKIHEGMEVAEQLAWLKARRPGAFCLESFYRITSRRWPSAKAVWKHYRRIMDQLLGDAK